MNRVMKARRADVWLFAAVALAGLSMSAAASDDPPAAVAEKSAAVGFAASQHVRHKPVIRLARSDLAPRGCYSLGCSGYIVVGVGF